MSLEQEQRIEHLQKTCNILSNALKTVDDNIERAAAKYLRSPIPKGRLKFADFMELLVLETRREVRSEIRRDKNMIDSLPEQVRRRLEEMLEKKVSEMLPKITGKISDYVTIPILIQPKSQPPLPFERYHPPAAYYAMPLRGDIKQVIAETPLAAYQGLRERLILELFSVGPSEMVRHLLQYKTLGTDTKYARATPFMTETVEGFTIVSKLLEEPK